jgi:hypothetical protein
VNFGSPNAFDRERDLVALHRDAGERRALHAVTRHDGGTAPILPGLREVDHDVQFVARNADISFPAGFERFRGTDEPGGGQDDGYKYAHQTIRCG